MTEPSQTLRGQTFDEIKNGGLPCPYKSYRRMTENLKKGENP